jgi:hypothetical protein
LFDEDCEKVEMNTLNAIIHTIAESCFAHGDIARLATAAAVVVVVHLRGVTGTYERIPPGNNDVRRVNNED